MATIRRNDLLRSESMLWRAASQVACRFRADSPVSLAESSVPRPARSAKQVTVNFNSGSRFSVGSFSMVTARTGPTGKDRNGSIVLKNSNFRGDHNSEGQGQARPKIL
jgi:hypothetical protein